jgi:hypothetical protein
VKLAEITTQRNPVADVVANTAPQVHTGFIMIGARCVVAGVVHAKVGMASTHRQVWVPDSVRASKVVGAINTYFFKFGMARSVFSVGVGPGINRF